MERDAADQNDRVSNDPVGEGERGRAGSTPLALGSSPARPAPVCPECGSTRYRELHHDSDVRRYECGNMKCMQSFSVSVRTGAHIERERAAIVPNEGGGDMKCAKCERTFGKQGWLERHEAKCSGGEAKVKKPKKVKAAIEVKSSSVTVEPHEDPAPKKIPSIQKTILESLDEQEGVLRYQLAEIVAIRKAIKSAEVSR